MCVCVCLRLYLSQVREHNYIVTYVDIDVCECKEREISETL